MKILMVNRNRGVEGGIERYIADITEELKRRGNSVDLLCADCREFQELFSSLYGLAQIWDGQCSLDAESKILLQEMLAESKPDIIYLHGVSNAAAIAILSAHAPTVVYVHDHKLTCPDGKRWLSNPDRKSVV